MYAPMAPKQQELYQALLNRNIHEFLKERHLIEKNCLLIENQVDGDKSRRRSKVNYAEDLNDDFLEEKVEYIEQILEENEAENHLKAASKKVNSMKLQNLIMQLRKACNHPLLFETQEEEDIDVSKIAQEAGKMQLLEKLLENLLKRGHKALIFSQMTRILEILEAWLSYKKWGCYRLDGSTKQDDRREMIEQFNRGKVPIFLLSTRAGGQGINLTAADTVIFYDSDWNPQMDLQAQARVHRIGQTRPVAVYRLVTANSIEGRMLEVASGKRKLEQLVMHQNRFKSVVQPLDLVVQDLQEILVSAPQAVTQLTEDDLDHIMDRSIS